MTPQSTFRRAASRSLVVSGVVSVAVGLLSLVYPPSVANTVWGYPFDSGTLVAVSMVLVIAHLLKAHGFLGLSRLDGAGPVTRWSMLAATLGFVVLAACEGASAFLGGIPTNSPGAVALNNGYGAGSMLEAVASVVGGTVIGRRGLLKGMGRWSVLLSGAFMIFVVTPALFTGRGPLAFLALTGWSLFYIWIGTALAHTENG